MIEVRSAQKVQTPGKERLTAMDGLRQTVTAIPRRKIGMAMMALFGLVAYIKTLFGGSEVAAQASSDAPFGEGDTGAPICETDNSSADNSGRMSHGNAALFQASARDDDEGATLTSPQSSPSSVLSPASSGLQPERFDVQSLQPAPLNFQPSAFATAPTPGLGGGGGDDGTTDPGTPPFGGGAGGGGDTMTPPPGNGPDDEDTGGEDGTPQEPPVTPPANGGGDDGEAEDGKDGAPCDPVEDGGAPCDDLASCDGTGSDCNEPAGCDLSTDCDLSTECDPFAGTDADCFDDPLLATREVILGLPTEDDLLGTLGDDLVHAGDGNDTVFGDAGDDLLIGAAGDDILHGGIGHDRLAGGQGADTLDGGAGDDTLTGGAGDDTLWDGTGTDLLFGDDGNDTIHLAADDAPDTIDGGAGIDTLVLSPGGEPLEIDIAAGTITRPALPQDSFTSIEIFSAGTGQELFDLSGLFSGQASATPGTVFQITDFGHDDKLVLTDDIHLALSDLQAVTDTREIRDDSSDFEARISVFDPETVAQTHGRPGFAQGEEDALMIRRIELRQDHEAGDIAFDIWISGPEQAADPSQDFTS
jgi:hypothetical protein